MAPPTPQDWLEPPDTSPDIVRAGWKPTALDGDARTVVETRPAGIRPRADTAKTIVDAPRSVDVAPTRVDHKTRRGQRANSLLGRQQHAPNPQPKVAQPQAPTAEANARSTAQARPKAQAQPEAAAQSVAQPLPARDPESPGAAMPNPELGLRAGAELESRGVGGDAELEAISIADDEIMEVEDFGSQLLARSLEEAHEELDVANSTVTQLRKTIEELRSTCLQLATEKTELNATIEELTRARVGDVPPPAGAGTGGPAALPVHDPSPTDSAYGFRLAFGSRALEVLEHAPPDERDADAARQIRSSRLSLRVLITAGVMLVLLAFVLYSGHQELSHGGDRISVPIAETYGTPSRFDAPAVKESPPRGRRSLSRTEARQRLRGAPGRRPQRSREE